MPILTCQKAVNRQAFHRLRSPVGTLLNEFSIESIVVPLTTQMKGYKDDPVLMANKSNGLKKEPAMLIFHVGSISKGHLVEKEARLPLLKSNRL